MTLKFKQNTAENEETKELYNLAEKLEQLLFEKNAKLVTAESCTGGLIAEIVTSVPGSSSCFDRGFVTYSNESKIELLGVNLKTLETYGAVSENTACEMAEGALQKSHAQVSVSVTGIAGPTGGTKEKPIGTVCIAWKHASSPTESTTQFFCGDRNSIRKQAAKFVLQKLIDLLSGSWPGFI